MKKFDLSTLTVLIAGDSRHMRSLMHGILMELGVNSIHEAADGREAFEIIKDRKIDIIIIDQHMKPVSGMEFLHWLRRAPESPNPFIPVIMVTADSTKKMTQAARDAGVNAFVAKPMSARNLVDKLMFVLKDSRKII